MGLLSDIFGFIEDLTSGDSFYKEKSISKEVRACWTYRNQKNTDSKYIQ